MNGSTHIETLTIIEEIKRSPTSSPELKPAYVTPTSVHNPGDQLSQLKERIKQIRPLSGTLLEELLPYMKKLYDGSRLPIVKRLLEPTTLQKILIKEFLLLLNKEGKDPKALAKEFTPLLCGLNPPDKSEELVAYLIENANKLF